MRGGNGRNSVVSAMAARAYRRGPVPGWRTSMAATPCRVGLLLFPDVTQLVMAGPYEVLTKRPGAEVHLVGKTKEAVQAGGGMQILPTTTYAACPQLDLVCVPGGSGVNPLMEDEETLEFLRRQAAGARYVTSVCTGS